MIPKLRGGETNLSLILLTVHPSYSKLFIVNINWLLTPTAQNKVFSEVPVVGFKKRKSLKDLYVKAKVPLKKDRRGILWLSGKTLRSLHFSRRKKPLL